MQDQKVVFLRRKSYNNSRWRDPPQSTWRLYANQGVDVVIDDVCAPPNFVEQYAALFEIPEVQCVLLYPKAPIVIERIKQRGGPWEPINYVPAIYSFLDSMSKDGWIVLDSSEWTIEQ